MADFCLSVCLQKDERKTKYYHSILRFDPIRIHQEGKRLKPRQMKLSSSVWTYGAYQMHITFVYVSDFHCLCILVKTVVCNV